MQAGLTEQKQKTSRPQLLLGNDTQLVLTLNLFAQLTFLLGRKVLGD